jgi:hypothetical protein
MTGISVVHSFMQTGLVIIAGIGTSASSSALLLDSSDICICSVPGDDAAVSTNFSGSRSRVTRQRRSPPPEHHQRSVICYA